MSSVGCQTIICGYSFFQKFRNDLQQHISLFSPLHPSSTRSLRTMFPFDVVTIFHPWSEAYILYNRRLELPGSSSNTSVVSRTSILSRTVSRVNRVGLAPARGMISFVKKSCRNGKTCSLYFLSRPLILPTLPWIGNVLSFA